MNLTYDIFWVSLFKVKRVFVVAFIINFFLFQKREPFFALKSK